MAAVAVATILFSSWAGIAPVRADTPAAPIVDPSTVAPGQSFTVSGGYCDGIVTVTIAGLALSDHVDGGTPPWVLSFNTPTDATPGPYTVVSKCSYFDFPDTTVTVSGEATTTTTAPSESISLVKTVTTTPGVCGTTSSISVPAAQEGQVPPAPRGATNQPAIVAYYCYTVTNNTQSTLVNNMVTDDKIAGFGVTQDIAPGATVNTVELGYNPGALLETTTTNTATWTGHSPSGLTFTATASATVTITAAPAVAAAAEASFTG